MTRRFYMITLQWPHPGGMGIGMHTATGHTNATSAADAYAEALASVRTNSDAPRNANTIAFYLEPR